MEAPADGRARRHAEEGFRIEDEAAALDALYRKLLDGDRP